MSKAKASARDIVCKNNLRQIGIGLQLYVDLHGRYLGSQHVWKRPGEKGLDFFQDYVGSKSSFGLKRDMKTGQDKTHISFCPRTKRPKQLIDPNKPSMGYMDQRPKYEYNLTGTGKMAPGVEGHLGLGNRVESQVKAPSQMWSFSCGNFHCITDTFVRNLKLIENVPKSKMYHRGRINLVACDAHVETRTIEQLEELNAEERRRWNYDNLPHRETWENFNSMHQED